MVTFIGERSKIKGHSMNSLLKDKDQVIIEKLSYQFRKPRRFEIIAIGFKARGIRKEYYIKRIIAVPGESIQIKQGCIYINGKKLDESFGLEPIKYAGLAKRKITLKRNEYFVLGDNRNDSLDSRDKRVGMVHKHQIIGRIWIKIKLFNR